MPLTDIAEVLRVALLAILSPERSPETTIGLTLLFLLGVLHALYRAIMRIRRYIRHLVPQQSRLSLQWRRCGISFGTPPGNEV